MTIIVFVCAFIGFFSVMALMALGVMAGRKPLTGSCGGVGAALNQENYICEICGDNPAKCIEVSENSNSSGDPKYWKP